MKNKILSTILDKIAEHFKCNHHVNFNIHTINSFDKDNLEGAIACVNTSGENIHASEIRRSLNGYYYFQVVSER